MAKRILSVLILLILSSTLLHGAFGAVSEQSIAPFIGTWKLDPSRSHLFDQMRIEPAGPNTYRLNFSGDNIETIVADGADQPGLFGTTFAITVQDASHWKAVRKLKGRTTIIGIWQLSPDGRTLTDNFTGYHDDGTTTHLHYIYQRTAGPAEAAGASGFVGAWASITEDVNSSYEIEIRPFEASGLSFVNAASRITQSLQFDGKDYPASGGNAFPGSMSSGRVVNEHAIERTDKINGKVFDTQQIELSPDGKVLTMTVHVPGRVKPNVMVFDRK